MRINSIKIGRLHTENNIFLAPLAGYTNAVFRKTCFDLGAGLTFTEMVSAKGLSFNSEKTEALLRVTDGYGGIKACQIFGNDSYYMRKACESEALAPFDIVDINMGCPVPKIYKNGEGSALLNDMPLAEKIISECVKSGKIITVKFRTGADSGHIVTAEFARMCESAGASLICIHGRTRDKMYSGAVDFSEIAKAKNAVKIPVVANGGVFCKEDAEELFDKTGADGIAVARGAMYKPWIFAEITGRDTGNKRDIVRGQIEDMRALYGERFACVFMRKMIAFYLKGTKDSTKIKQQLFAAESTVEVERILDTVQLID